MSTGLRYCLAIFGLAAVISLVFTYVSGGVNLLTVAFRGEVAEKEQTVGNADFRIGSYEEYFDVCESVQNAEAQIVSLNDELKTDPPSYRVTQINASITAVKSSRVESINEYNLMAAKEHKRAFKDADLPVRLQASDNKTECGS